LEGFWYPPQAEGRSMIDSIFLEGCRAYILFQPVTACPYTNVEECSEWEAGWHYEQEMDEYVRYMDDAFKAAGVN
jgi:ribosome modulation factor